MMLFTEDKEKPNNAASGVFANFKRFPILLINFDKILNCLDK